MKTTIIGMLLSPFLLIARQSGGAWTNIVTEGNINMKTMKSHWTHRVLTAAYIAVFCRVGIAQVSPATILKIDLQNFVQYNQDEPSYGKFALSGEATTAPLAANFAHYILIGDIVAVNGRPARGAHVCRVQQVNMATAATPGQAIGDVQFPFLLDCVEDLVQVDGTPIGAFTFMGRANGPPPPGAPLEQPMGGTVVTGGNGAFLGVRGQGGEVRLARVRRASVTEDPSRRRIHGGGNVTLIFHLIPMFRPEIVTTANGPAVVHSSDFSLVTASNPARSGELLTLFASGLGPTRPGVDPGQPFAADPVQIVNSPVELTVNGKSAAVLYAGGYPGAVDRYQVNFRVPEGTAAGLAAVQLTSAWISGPEVKIAVQ